MRSTPTCLVPWPTEDEVAPVLDSALLSPGFSLLLHPRAVREGRGTSKGAARCLTAGGKGERERKKWLFYVGLGVRIGLETWQETSPSSRAHHNAPACSLLLSLLRDCGLITMTNSVGRGRRGDGGAVRPVFSLLWRLLFEPPVIHREPTRNGSPPQLPHPRQGLALGYGPMRHAAVNQG